MSSIFIYSLWFRLKLKSSVCRPSDSTERPLVHFSLHDVHNTTTLLLSDDGSTLYVGARDAVLSLDISQSDVISLRRKVINLLQSQWSSE